MKKVLLLAVALVFGFSTFAQVKHAQIPDKYKNLTATGIKKTIHEVLNFSTDVNPSVAPMPPKAISETQIGTTVYDLQTNNAVQNRIHLYSDGTIGATFTFGLTNPSFADRGTGYNYYDGSAWAANPTARVEANRCGWPSYAPLGATGEVVVTHNGSTGLLVNTRATKGTGAWSQSVIIGPPCSNGTTALLWPRMITSGNTIHIIACTDQAESPDVWYYEGLALAIVYIRSTDGGVTWDAPVILPGMDSLSIVNNCVRGFSGDAYSWAKPQGDTIAFVYGDVFQDMFVMKSFDGGDTWTKTTVYDFPTLSVFPSPMFCSTDGAVAIALDNAGKAHVAFGRMVMQKSSGDPDSIGYYSYRPYTDGLVYWNENMPVLDTTQLGNLDSLDTHGQLAAYMQDFNNDDTINFPAAGTGEWPFGEYQSSLSSFPQILVDGNIVYVTYSQCREDRIDANSTKLLRHLFVNKFEAGSWCGGTDITADILHEYDECMFGSLSYTSDDKLHIVYQADETVGVAAGTTGATYGNNSIYYTSILKTDVCSDVSIKENDNTVSMNIYPNPSNDFSYIDLNLASASKVNVTITNLVGQEVFNKAYGQLSSGNHKLTVNVSNLNSGIYFFTVQSGSERITKKMIVE
ncbi:MAG TPA: T9SS type A sorting domain-containing protein [Bacteroidales bacterium]|nr:T9SS type A sorting domain-containing protein [Bacteroidales bacterium]